MADASGGPPSLLGATIRRAFVLGRIYLVLGAGLSLFYAVVLSLAGGTAFATAFPLLLPVLASLGGMGGMMVFTNDRVKGVFEYLIAYGVSPRRLFVNVLIASLVLLTVIMGPTVAVGLGAYVASGHVLTEGLVASLVVYSIPMGYASVAFAATMGMFWTSLSSPMAGMSSPLGVVPLLGMAPTIITLAVAGAVRTSALYVVVSAVVLIGAVVLVLISPIGRLLRPERLLSPA